MVRPPAGVFKRKDAGAGNYPRSRIGLVQRFKAWRSAKKEDRAAIARALQEERRAADEPPKSISDTVEDAAGEFPPLG